MASQKQARRLSAAEIMRSVEDSSSIDFKSRKVDLSEAKVGREFGVTRISMK